MNESYRGFEPGGRIKGCAAIFADVLVNRADVWMIQSRGRFGFASESVLGLAGRGLTKEFQSNEAVEASVLGLVDHTHTAAEFLGYAAMGHALANERLGLWYVASMLGCDRSPDHSRTIFIIRQPRHAALGPALLCLEGPKAML